MILKPLSLPPMDDFSNSLSDLRSRVAKAVRAAGPAWSASLLLRETCLTRGRLVRPAPERATWPLRTDARGSEPSPSAPRQHEPQKVSRGVIAHPVPNLPVEPPARRRCGAYPT